MIPGVEVKPMFGQLGAFVNGNMFAGLFGSSIGVKLDEEMTVPLWSAWLTLAACCLLCLWLLSRRIKAYEVVR